MLRKELFKRKLFERRIARDLILALIILVVSSGQAYGVTGGAVPGGVNTETIIVHSAGEADSGFLAQTGQAFNLRVLSQHANRKKGEESVVQASGDSIKQFQATIYRKTRPGVTVYSNSYTGSAAEIRWDGRDNKGIPVANGSYVLKIAAVDFDGLTHTDLVQLEVNNAQSPAPTPDPTATEPIPQATVVSYQADGAASIFGRVASAFVPGAGGRLGKLKVAMLSTGSQAYIRADNGGSPGEILAAYNLAPQTDLSQINFEEIALPVSPASLEQGKTYWLEGPGTAIYSSVYALTLDWSYAYQLWYDTGWRRPFAMELSVTPL